MISIFTDGSCYYKSGQGGAGAYIISGEKEFFISEGFKSTTISRMEGMAVYLAIKSLKEGIEDTVNVYSDSEYIVKSFTEKRLDRWVKSGFVGVKNVDMWRAILNEISMRPNIKFAFRHVRGHESDIDNPITFGNNVADRLADYKLKKIYKEDKFE